MRKIIFITLIVLAGCIKYKVGYDTSNCTKDELTTAEANSFVYTPYTPSYIKL